MMKVNIYVNIADHLVFMETTLVFLYILMVVGINGASGQAVHKHAEMVLTGIDRDIVTILNHPTGDRIVLVIHLEKIMKMIIITVFVNYRVVQLMEYGVNGLHGALAL